MSPEVPVILLVLATPVFLFWYWFYRKRIASKVKRRFFIWISTVISTPIFYATLIGIWIFCITYYPNRDFDRKRWIRDKQKRYELAKDIIDSKMLIGKNKSEVSALLGVDENKIDNNDWYYYLGFVPELVNIDQDVLQVSFRNGRVYYVSEFQE
ncbi:hypothetical protein C8P68_105102 [Mucilaginibacter yixingensis]|uniref:Outer membrane protein assembly factor BamE n=1 Tax=Mucilaginibacter yixingensis TaxID=1295612 RepID=A0A2T5J802_9SPHI|nr:hypothetical protein [Mucilaginibacter yixingensis]PTQ95597.1 hypothetical protein C8P68_105102 [Mucilaginibacter yixingensis]